MIQPYDGRGSAMFAVLMGCVSGVAVLAVTQSIEFASLGLRSRWLAVAAMFLIPFLFGVVTALSVIRLRTAVFLGALCWVSLSLFATIFESMLSGDGGASFFIVQPLKFIVFPAFVVSAILGLVGALLHACLFMARRAFVFELIEDDGGHCVRCGYELGSPDLARCPECGESTSNRCYRWRWFFNTINWARRRARVMAVLLAVAVAIPAGWIVATRTVPAAPFMWRFRDGKIIGESSVYIWLDKDAQRALVLTYDWRRMPDADALTAYDGHFFTVGGSGSAIDPGNPWITWVFSRAQADYVLKHGLPASFLREVDEARERFGAAPGQTARVPDLTFDVSFDPADDPG
ncbi:MAG: hypothetical protein IID31_11370 [Planctomycetes bacterium]|nr:hypothetical protein [Planctomycetota bacterium]